MPDLYVITGTQAAGKSTVGRLLAERLPRSVFVEGDLIRTVVVNGREDMTADPSNEALHQLLLRYEATLSVAETYLAAGFDAVVSDVVIGEALTSFVHLVRRPQVYLVVLDPDLATVRAREAGRAKTGYGDVWSYEGLYGVLQEETPRLGLWLDTSELGPAETVDAILARRAEAVVAVPQAQSQHTPR